MEVQTREHENVVILDLTGPLVAGVGDRILRQSMNELVVEGWEKILLNLSKVSRIDSTGIGELVASIKMAKRFGSTVRLVEISQQVRHILDLSRILPLLDFYEDEEEALKWSSEKAAEDDAPE
jgi:anti-sigma B factor antagonist